MKCKILNVQKYSNSLTQHRRTQNLNASVYILSINWYIRSDWEMWQHIVAVEEMGARYRHNVQQDLLKLIYMYRTRFIKWRKNEGGSKILNWGRGVMIFCDLPCCINELEYFWTFNITTSRRSSILMLSSTALVQIQLSQIVLEFYVTTISFWYFLIIPAILITMLVRTSPDSFNHADH